MIAEEALFDAGPILIRKGADGYLTQIAGTYDGLPLWALAPVDKIIRRQYQADPNRTEFVWLIQDHRPVWALVDLDTHIVVALGPEPVEKSVRELLVARA